MSDFRTKLLGLAAVVTAFTGMSYGQLNLAASVPGSAGCATPTVVNQGFLARAESEAELISDVTIGPCTGSASVNPVTIVVTLSLPVTSKAISPAVVGLSANSEAVLVVTAPAQAGPPAVAAENSTYYGYVTGQLVTFQNVNLQSGFTLKVQNIRVNATLAGAVNSVVPVTEQIIIGQNGTSIYTPVSTPPPVAQVLKSLSATVFNPLPPNSLNPATITVCQGTPIPAKGPVFGNTPQFTVNVAETFPGAFKYQTDPFGVIQDQEQGSNVTGAAGVGTASSATQITVTYANVPGAATLYVPTSITNPNVGGVPWQLTLQTSQTPATGGITTVPLAGFGDNFGAYAALPTPAAGVVTATYLVTSTNANQLENFNIPTFIGLSAGTAAVPLAPQGAITVLVAYGPAGTLTTGLPTSVPLFAPSTATPLNAQTVIVCQTTLLFPFVTNAGTFETGMSIANTSTDNLGVAGVTVSSPTNGSCALNFYGNAAQPKSVTFPPTGLIGAYVASPAQGPTYADTLSDLIGTGTNFTGYVIAQCNFLEAHGFAFITDYGNSTSAYAEGYLAIVVPNARLENFLMAAGSTTGQ